MNDLILKWTNLEELSTFKYKYKLQCITFGNSAVYNFKAGFELIYFI